MCVESDFERGCSENVTSGCDLKNERVCLIAQSCLTVCDPVDCSLTRLVCPWNFPRQYWSGQYSLLQRYLPYSGKG